MQLRNTEVSPDAVVVEVVEDGQAALVALPVVWLGSTSPDIGSIKISISSFSPDKEHQNQRQQCQP